MTVWLLLTGAVQAAPVQCDPELASALQRDARIPSHRLPFTHPELVPGLALADPHTDPRLYDALVAQCAEGGALSVVADDLYQTATWSAHSLLLTRTTTAGCALRQRTLAISVGVGADQLPRYSLREMLADAITPVGDCQTASRYREERVLAGASGPLRVVLVSDHLGEQVQGARVVLRQASAGGWTTQLLEDPAAADLGDAQGPRYAVTERWAERWVVRRGGCPSPGQQVWTQGGAGWVPRQGREALELLASRGLWRLAGQEAWLLIVAQDSDEDQSLLAPRMRRMQQRTPEPLSMWPSSLFPGLNPGFLIVVPPPFLTREAAEAARRAWGWRRQGYVKRAWRGPSCSGPQR